MSGNTKNVRRMKQVCCPRDCCVIPVALITSIMLLPCSPCIHQNLARHSRCVFSFSLLCNIDMVSDTIRGKFLVQAAVYHIQH